MASLVTYYGLQIVNPAPTGDGGAAIQSNFVDLVDWNPKSTWTNTTNPTASDNASSPNYYNAGSHWLNTTSLPPQLFFCEYSDTTTATWQSILSAVVQDPAPQLGGNLNLNGHQIYDASSVIVAIGSSEIAEVTSSGLQIPSIGIGIAPNASYGVYQSNSDLSNYFAGQVQLGTLSGSPPAGVALYVNAPASNSIPVLQITNGTVSLDFSSVRAAMRNSARRAIMRFLCSRIILRQ